jgi:hypothetical protein
MARHFRIVHPKSGCPSNDRISELLGEVGKWPEIKASMLIYAALQDAVNVDHLYCQRKRHASMADGDMRDRAV